MKTTAPASLTVMAMALLVSGCLLFPDSRPVYGTNLRVRSSTNGDEYLGIIGDSRTTSVEGVLDNRGMFSLSFSYTDSYALFAESITIDTDYGRTILKPIQPTRQELSNITVLETCQVQVNQTLFEQMADSDTPVIYIEGRQGTIIIKVGTQGKQNLEDLLDYRMRSGQSS